MGCFGRRCSFNGRRQLSKKGERATSASEPKLSATAKRKTSDRMAKLKSSSWYEGAVRSIAISKEKLVETNDEWID